MSKRGDILAALQADITTRLAPRAVKFATGRRNLAARDNPPRIVWAFAQDTIGPASRSVPQARVPQRFGRSVATVQATVEAHCWGGDLDEAEALADAVMLAVHAAAPGVSALRGLDWESPNLNERGEAVAVTFVVHVPVADTAPGTVTPTARAFDTTGAAAGDGVLEPGDT